MLGGNAGLRVQPFLFGRPYVAIGVLLDDEADLVDLHLRELASGLCTWIDEADRTASLDLAFAVAEHFGLKPNNARKIASEIGNAVKNWRQTAKTLGLSVDQINRMASAFEHKELEQATAGTDQIIGR